MNTFEESVLRLKQQLKVTDDKEVAEALGISASALNMRKKRGNFPTKEVFALAAQRPEFGLDPDWIVSGSTSRTEIDDKNIAYLVQCYQVMNPHDRAAMLKIAGTLSDVANLSGEEIMRRLNNYKPAKS